MTNQHMSFFGGVGVGGWTGHIDTRGIVTFSVIHPLGCYWWPMSWEYSHDLIMRIKGSGSLGAYTQAVQSLILVPFYNYRGAQSSILVVLPHTVIAVSHLTDPQWLRTESWRIDFGINWLFYNENTTIYSIMTFQPRRACIPLPCQSEKPPTLDPILQRLQSRTMMNWSICEHPSTASSNMALPYGEVWQNRPATSPCIPSLTIWSKPTKDRPIVIIGDPYVTIGDVLRHVHAAIRNAAREYYQPTPQLPLLHPYALQPVSDIDERQMRQWVLCYLQGYNTWKGLSFHDLDSWWLDIWRWSWPDSLLLPSVNIRNVWESQGHGMDDMKSKMC